MSKKKKETWYTARCHFRSYVRGKTKLNAPLWQESFFLVSAISRKHAQRKAKKLAGRRRQSYENFAGDVVVWRLAKIIDVFEMKDRDFREGTELYSQYFAPRNLRGPISQPKR